MKKIFASFDSRMIRPAVYQGITKAVYGLFFVLVFDRFFNARLQLDPLRDLTVIAAAVFFGSAWVNYLRFDGLSLKFLEFFRSSKERKRKSFHNKDMIDFADEHITTMDELEDEERYACGFASSLVCGLLFLTCALIGVAIWAVQ